MGLWCRVEVSAALEVVGGRATRDSWNVKDVISLLKAWSLCVSQSQITREGVLAGTHLVPLTYETRKNTST